MAETVVRGAEGESDVVGGGGYAGAVIVLISAVASHVMVGDPFAETVPAIMVMGITLGSYALRPASRKLGR